MNFLAVDDERASLDKVVGLIEKIKPGSQCFAFDSALSALAKAREEEIDVAFLDVNMPELSGIDLGKYLVELNPSMNIIFLTEHKEFAFEAMQLHASGYIFKPEVEERIGKELDSLRYPEIRKKYKYTQDIDNTERCSEERTMFIREFILDLWFELRKRDPIGFVSWKAIFLWEKWHKTAVFFDYDIIGRWMDDIFILQDDQNGGDKYVFSYDWTPVLAWRKDGKNIIIYWDQEIAVNGEYHGSISETIIQIVNYKINKDKHKS